MGELELIKSKIYKFDVAICDIKYRGRPAGLKIIKKLK